MPRRGVFIVLEGCERAGKTTQCRMLKDTLTKLGHEVELFRYIDRSTAIGKLVDDHLQKRIELEDHAAHLLFSANGWENIPRIKKLVEEGVVVIMDRYAYSGVASPAATFGFSLEWCKQAHVGLPRPDLVLFMKLSPEESAKREGFGEERNDSVDLQKQVASNYETLSKEEGSYWKVMDAAKTPDSLHTELTRIITDLLSSEELPPLATLWTDLDSKPSI